MEPSASTNSGALPDCLLRVITAFGFWFGIVVVVFAYAFYVLDKQSPGQVAGMQTRLDSLYFAMTTMTTICTGDVHAAGQTARALVLIQMVFNVLFVATAATLLTTRIRTAAELRSQERRTQHNPK